VYGRTNLGLRKCVLVCRFRLVTCWLRFWFGLGFRLRFWFWLRVGFRLGLRLGLRVRFGFQFRGKIATQRS
jgi:hypothetical protein